jgi:DUF438 domain-containing protein
MTDESPVSRAPGQGAAVPEAGSLTPEQMELVLRHLPVDVSLMDERHVLAYWRGPTFEECGDEYIGRHIDDCHNAKSRAAIAGMIAAFTAGTSDEEVFWHIEDGHQKVTRYTAVRDAGGAYRGMMEVIIDLTAIDGYRGKGNTLDE